MNHALNSRISRRRLVQGTAAAGALALAGTSKAAHHEKLKKGSVILFQGDSITDAGRDKKNQVANNARSLGRGYPAIIGGGLLGKYPELGLQVHNRGISGHKVPDLAKRWQKDAIDLKPDILSILIGVNDMWHKLGGRYKGTVKDYENGFRDLLKDTKEKLPKVKLVICEPFVLRCGAINDKWFPEFDERRAAAKLVADEFKSVWVPFQSMFDTATKSAEPAFWAGDGVHPTLSGHALMAATWREVVGI